MKNTAIFRSCILVINLLLVGIFVSHSQSEVTVPFKVRYENRVRGDMTMIANNILNKVPPSANTPFNGGGSNNGYDMQYIDIDGDPSTFSSSSATLNISGELGCYRIVYAGLYWSGLYRYETADVQNGNNDGNGLREEDYDQVKLKLPGGGYMDISGEVIYDAFDEKDEGLARYSPYACYADITEQVTGLDDPTGEYTVANIRATQGYLQGGSSAGWTVFFVYEDLSLPGRFITSFDGFASIASQSAVDVDIPVSGFKTNPTGPVRANLMTIALEGDRDFAGDQFQFKAASANNFVTLGDGLNPANDFFNSRLSINGTEFLDRTPNSQNTLGYDAVILNIDHLLDNNETEAEMRLQTRADGYYTFFNAFSVEVVTPDVKLIKTVEDLNGNDIAGEDVGLGDPLVYILEFENVGNDDATDFTIRDVLPVNTQNVDIDVKVSDPEITWTHDTAANEFDFNIPDRMVNAGDPKGWVRIEVKVVTHCNNLRDACSNIIRNQAFATYNGAESGTVISDDPSLAGVNDCYIGEPVPTNFLVNTEACDFKRKETLCGAELRLTAGGGFETYTWTNDKGDEIGDTQSITVNTPGTYNVFKTVPEGSTCPNLEEVITVERSGALQENPLIPYADKVEDCTNDGDKLPKFFLCGNNDTRPVDIEVINAEVRWEKLDENSSCQRSDRDAVCANKSSTCTWNEVAIGPRYEVGQDGDGHYRAVVTYQGGCFSRFYFDVYGNNLDPQATIKDLVCGSPGKITVDNIPGGYEYQLKNYADDTVVTPWQSGNEFTIDNPGGYTVEIKQSGIENGCVFTLENIGIRERDFQVKIETTPVTCKDGKIDIKIEDVEPQYTYKILTQTGVTIESEGPTDDNRFIYQVTNAGNYRVEVSTDDGCTLDTVVKVDPTAPLELTANVLQHVSCGKGGRVQMHAKGGQRPYWYAIYSIDGELQNPKASEGDFVKEENGLGGSYIFEVEKAGTYRFMVMDDYGCTTISKEPVTVEEIPPLNYEVEENNVSCYGASDGSVTVTVTDSNTNGYTLSYELKDADGNDVPAEKQTETGYENLAPGNYTLTVIQTRGNSSCSSEPHDITITQPDTPLTATSGVSETVECDTDNGAQTRVVNAEGGTAPYEYSFDGGATYNSDNVGYLSPGDYNVYIKDATGCVYTMQINVPEALTPPEATAEIDGYNCEGEAQGTVTVTGTSTEYNYWYEIDGVVNTPDSTSSVFSGIPSGDHTISVKYITKDPPAPAPLLEETFGAGATTTTPYISDVYCYEPQTGNGENCSTNTDPRINDGEYAVTGKIENLFSSWFSPTDHTGDTDGRMLVINVGGVAGVGGVIYKKPVKQAIPDRDVTVSLWGMNLLRTNATGGDPNVVIQLVDTSGNVIAEHTTSNIPKDEEWHNYTIPLNPGNNTELDIVIRTNSNIINGNDIAIDDIHVYQYPKQCPGSLELPLVIEDGQGFNPELTQVNDALCSNSTETSVTISVDNFDPANGYDYSIDGGNTWTTGVTESIITEVVPIDAGKINVLVRYAEGECEESFTEDVTFPEPTTVTATITEEASCTTGADITAEASGGTPPYRFSIDDGASWSAEGASQVFSDIASGMYAITVRDKNFCETVSDSITVDAPAPVEFTTEIANCYNGDNNGELVVTVNSGNEGYQFRRNGGPWETPNPPAADSFHFTGLPSGTHTIEVKDASGCTTDPQDVVIREELTAVVTPTNINCNNGEIAVTASGGDSNYVYAFVKTGTAVTPSDFSASATFEITSGNDGDYDVYVRDNNGEDGYCEYTEQTVTVNQAPALAITVEPEHPVCSGDTGAVEVETTSGEGLYTIVVNKESGEEAARVEDFTGPSKTFFNLDPGTYSVKVTDRYGCEEEDTVTVEAPAELTADLEPILPADCSETDPNEYGVSFKNFPSYAGLTVEFSIDNGANWSETSDFTGYISGTRLFPAMRTVDANGDRVCRTDLGPYEVPYPPVSLVIDAVASATDCGFQVTVEGSEGVSPYTFAIGTGVPPDPNDDSVWEDPDTPSDDTYVFTGLTPGRTYDFYVKDATGCVRMNDVDIYEDFDLIDTEVTFRQIPACNGEQNGEITFTVDDKDGTHEDQLRWELFDINDNSVQSGGPVAYNTPPVEVEVKDLAPGEYYLLVTQVDNNGDDACYGASRNVLIEEANPITITGTTGEDISCNSPGTIRINGTSGGWGDYTYTLSGANLKEDIVSNANPVEVPYDMVGDPAVPVQVTISINDGRGCTASDVATETINVSELPSIDNITVTNCARPFSIEIAASGGSGNYNYSMDGGVSYSKNDGVFGNVAAGTYEVQLMDSNGCIAGPVTVNVYPPLEADIRQTKALDCTASPEGEITITVSGGSENYEYEIGRTTTVTRAVLPSDPYTFKVSGSGDYQVTVYDVKTGSSVTHAECQVEKTVTVAEPVEPEFTATPTAVNCNGAEDGIIRLSATDNGINPLTYNLSPMPAGAALMADGNGFENLPAGSYSVTATGTNECTTTVSDIEIQQPDAISVPEAAVTVTPFGCAEGNNGRNASIEVDAAQITGGTGTYVNYEFIAEATNDTVQSGSDSRLIWTDPEGGDFTVNVYDSNGCTGTATTTITPYDELTEAEISTTPTSCAEGANASLRAVTTTGDFSKLEWSLDNGDGDPETNNWQAYGTTVDNLDPGAYFFLLRHRETGCVLRIAHAVEEPEGFDINVAIKNDVRCAGSETGAVTFEMTDTSYTGVFRWEIFHAADSTSTGKSATHDARDGATPETEIGAGSYYVEITQLDFPNCTRTKTFGIAGPLGGDIKEETKVSVSLITCTEPTGTIRITASGGWGGHTYYVAPATDPAPGDDDYTDIRVFTELEPNTYQLWVKDAGGCAVQLDGVSLEAPQDIFADIVANPGTGLQCIGDTNVEVSAANVTGGSGEYLYRLNIYEEDGTTIASTSAINNSPAFGNLGAGTYSITVEDNWDCKFTTETITITEPEPIEATLAIEKDLSCKGDAILKISATGGSGNGYTYSLDKNGAYTTDDTFTVGAGTYQYYVKDANDCEPVLSNRVTVNEVEDITIEIDNSAAKVNCSGESTATIRARAKGGLGNYQYILLDESQAPVAGQQNTTGEFTQLPAGTYYVQVQSGDCEKISVPVEVTEPDALQVEVETKEIRCPGDRNGRVTVTATGGTGIIQYAISPNLNQFHPGNVFDNLGPATYTIIAQDEAGCYEQLEVTISEPDPVKIELTFTEEVCKGDNAASITVDISGGKAPYTTSLNGRNDYVEGRLSFTDLEGGQTYVVFVKDANGCESNASVSIPEGVDITPSAEIIYGECKESSFENEVTIEIADPGEVTRVTYALDGDTPRTGKTFSNLEPGQHTVVVAHTNGCEKTVAFDIEERTPLEAITVTDIAHVSCYGDATGRITVQATGGTGDIEYAISDHTEFQKDNVFDALSAGVYTVVARDEVGCTVSSQVTVEEPSAPLDVKVVDIKEEICEGDRDASIEISVTGGIPPYRTSLNSNDNFVEEQFLFEDLSGGDTYVIHVEDARGCKAQVSVALKDPVIINPSAEINYGCKRENSSNTVTIHVNESAANDVLYTLDGMALQMENTFRNLSPGEHTVEVVHANGCFKSVSFVIEDITPLQLSLAVRNLNQITATASGGVGGYEYYVNGEPLGSKNTYYINQSGTYTVKVVDANGCEATAIMADMEFVDIEIPNVFTPNGDGYDDTWRIRNSEAFPDMVARVFDRYGRELAKLPQGVEWDGTYHGKQLPAGDYWYVIKLHGENDNREFTGHFNLYR